MTKRKYGQNPIDPIRGAFSIIPHDINTQPGGMRALYVGTGGDITLVCAGDDAPVTFQNVPTGTILPVCASMVLNTGTTAADMLGLT